MVCISAVGKHFPLAFFRKDKSVCFKYKGGFDFAYTYQPKVCFDQRVTFLWVTEVFLPWYDEQFPGLKCVLLLHDFNAHVEIDKQLKNVGIDHIIISPPNLTSWLQPMDQGIIAAINCAYTLLILESLINLVSDDTLWNFAVLRQMQCKRGEKGLAEGVLPHILDVIHICTETQQQQIDEEFISQCWRKADCLPPLLGTKIASVRGSHRHPQCLQPLEQQALESLCATMENLKVKASSKEHSDKLDVFDNTFVHERN